jgi:hypothetical protein
LQGPILTAITFSFRSLRKEGKLLCFICCLLGGTAVPLGKLEASNVYVCHSACCYVAGGHYGVGTTQARGDFTPSRTRTKHFCETLFCCYCCCWCKLSHEILARLSSGWFGMQSFWESQKRMEEKGPTMRIETASTLPSSSTPHFVRLYVLDNGRGECLSRF